ncbi:autotransporter outer membrane beta-barrel domain-containing protein [Enterobacter kobei]|uniref:autotransporter outer membrane beta-barrel domain-containing protein n=1 Tax=Enterobacter kobei TaxID=208224 RepID=UPI00236128D2|nr:autotransporter outer membrane beta-barrel domain-containing protein [Enterobacter kobei]
MSTLVVNIKGERGSPGILNVVNGGSVISPAFIIAFAGSEIPLYAIFDIQGESSRVFSEGQFGLAAGRDSVGYLTISKGGYLDTSLSLSNFIGISGGTGFVSVSGEKSVWNAGNITLGLDSTGVLKISDNATLKAKSINVDSKGRGWVIIGDRKNQESTGYIDSDSISLIPANSFLILNYTPKDYKTLWDLSGKGSIIFKNGIANIYGVNSISGNAAINDAGIVVWNNSALSKTSPLFMTQKGSVDLNGFSQIFGSYSSSGTTYFNQKANAAGTVLTVNGNYHGYGGTLVFNTALESDSSKTDFLHITGNVDGGTNVKVNNLGGKGSQTIEGIRLITVDGEIAKGTEFRQNGRIVAGAYDYRLVQGGQGGNNNSWYLTSRAGGVDPIAPP